MQTMTSQEHHGHSECEVKADIYRSLMTWKRDFLLEYVFINQLVLGIRRDE
jgi:hypothetical protein